MISRLAKPCLWTGRGLHRSLLQGIRGAILTSPETVACSCRSFSVEQPWPQPSMSEISSQACLLFRMPRNARCVTAELPHHITQPGRFAGRSSSPPPIAKCTSRFAATAPATSRPAQCAGAVAAAARRRLRDDRAQQYDAGVFGDGKQPDQLSTEGPQWGNHTKTPVRTSSRSDLPNRGGPLFFRRA